MNKLTLLKSACLSLVLLLVSSISFAAASSPVTMLQNTSDDMLNALSQTQQRDDASLYALIRKHLLPHVDLNRMSSMVTGRAWQTATPAQRSEFESEFTYFVVRTYSNALSSYNGEKVKIFPLRGGISGNQVEVKSAIEQKNGQRIAVNYRLVSNGADWKIYDFSVEGVSIVENYRSQFADVLRTGGIASLIQQLKQQNSKG